MILPERLDTPRLILRRATIADADAIFTGYAHDPEVTRYMTWRPHRSIDDTREFLDGCDARWQARTEGVWSMLLRSNGAMIGQIGMRPDAFKPNIGYTLARSYWGQGLMTEAGRAVVDLAFADPGVFRVWAVCDIDNVRSARVLEKVGMAREGVLRRWTIHPNVSDEPRDVLCYARVREPG